MNSIILKIFPVLPQSVSPWLSTTSTSTKTVEVPGTRNQVTKSFDFDTIAEKERGRRKEGERGGSMVEEIERVCMYVGKRSEKKLDGYNIVLHHCKQIQDCTAFPRQAIAHQSKLNSYFLALQHRSLLEADYRY